jgi:hypothetical protein
MPHKNITVAQDETFHPEICLVAIEPVSDFILVERYSEKRDCASWAATMNDSLAGLPVTVVQSTSDEGPGLLKYASGVLGAQHSPDIFHVQQEITRGTAASLNAQIRHTEAEYAKQCKCMNNHMTSKALLIETAIPSGKMMVSVDRDIKIAETQTQISLALQELETAHLRKQAVQNAKKALSDAYRPYDIITGKSRTTEEVHIDLEEQYSIIMEQAKAASLSEQGHKHLQKAHRVFDKMLSTLAFFWSMVVSQVAALGLSAEGVALMHNVLIAMYYLEISAKKAKGAVRRKEILDCVQQLREELERSAVWSTVDEEQRKRMRATARECAQLFQRSSSCVEGRNGYLSFRHHGLHHLSSRKLRVLGILHNYYVKRSDHSTAAGRFFESEPKDLFESLLNRLPMPARPRSKGGRSALVDGFQEAA